MSAVCATHTSSHAAFAAFAAVVASRLRRAGAGSAAAAAAGGWRCAAGRMSTVAPRWASACRSASTSAADEGQPSSATRAPAPPAARAASTAGPSAAAGTTRAAGTAACASCDAPGLRRARGAAAARTWRARAPPGSRQRGGGGGRGRLRPGRPRPPPRQPPPRAPQPPTQTTQRRAAPAAGAAASCTAGRPAGPGRARPESGFGSRGLPATSRASHPRRGGSQQHGQHAVRVVGALRGQAGLPARGCGREACCAQRARHQRPRRQCLVRHPAGWGRGAGRLAAGKQQRGARGGKRGGAGAQRQSTRQRPHGPHAAHRRCAHAACAQRVGLAHVRGGSFCGTKTGKFGQIYGVLRTRLLARASRDFGLLLVARVRSVQPHR